MTPSIRGVCFDLFNTLVNVGRVPATVGGYPMPSKTCGAWPTRSIRPSAPLRSCPAAGAGGCVVGARRIAPAGPAPGAGLECFHGRGAFLGCVTPGAVVWRGGLQLRMRPCQAGAGHLPAGAALAPWIRGRIGRLSELPAWLAAYTGWAGVRHPETKKGRKTGLFSGW